VPDEAALLPLCKGTSVIASGRCEVDLRFARDRTYGADLMSSLWLDGCTVKPSP
jgi:hypothetical protein